MIDISEELFDFGESLKFIVSRHDFEDLGTIFEFSVTTKRKGIFFLNFFTEQFIEITSSELVVLTQEQHMIDDNSLIFSQQTKQHFQFKIMNKDAHYLKIKCFTETKQDLCQEKLMVNLTTKEIIDKPTWKSTETADKKNQIALILEELNGINKGIKREKAELDKEKEKLLDKKEEIEDLVRLQYK